MLNAQSERMKMKNKYQTIALHARLITVHNNTSRRILSIDCLRAVLTRSIPLAVALIAHTHKTPTVCRRRRRRRTR